MTAHKSAQMRASCRLLVLLLAVHCAVTSTAASADGKVCINKPGSVGGALVFPVDSLTSSLQSCFQDIRKCASTKFSVCLQLRLDKIEANGCGKVFTTGGDTPYAFGSYLEFLGQRKFVFGVYGTDFTGASVRWEAAFEISKSSLPVTLCGTWEDRSGLILYVDGMRAIIKQNGVQKYMDRYFLNAIIPFQETMVFCRGKSGISPDDSGISNVCVQEAVWDSDTITNMPLSYADLGCTESSTVSPKYTVSSNLITSTQDRYQMDCFENCGYFRPNPSSVVDMKQIYGIQKNSPNYGLCMCIGQLSYLSDITTISCSSAPDLAFHLFLTSQLYLPPNVYTIFSTKVYNPYAADMFTGDSIAFELSIHRYSIGSEPAKMSPAEYTVSVDFGDGTSSVLKQSVFSHAYSSDGQKTVAIKVASIYGQNSTEITLTIKNKETEEAVDIDVVKIFPAQSGTDKSVAYTAVIAGRLSKTATIYVNGVQKEKFQVADYSTVKTGTVAVDAFGFYNISMCVNNSRTLKCSSAVVLIGDRVNRRAMCIGTADTDVVKIEFPMVDSILSKLKVVSQPDGAVVPHTTGPNSLSVRCASLAALGPRDLQLIVKYDSNMVVLPLRVHMNTCPTVAIVATKLSGLKDDTFPVKFRVVGVGRYELQLCDGLKACEFLVVDGLNGQLELDRNYVYGATGVFNVTLRAANDGCARDSAVMLGTQVPFKDAYIVAQPLKSLSEDLELYLYINTKFGLAIGGESNSVEVQLTGMEAKTYSLDGNFATFGPFVLKYKVSNFGKFTITAVMKNLIGSLTVTNQTSVGAEISNPAVQLIQPVGGPSRSVQFAVTISKGFPISFQLGATTEAGAAVTQTINSFNPNDYADNTTIYLWRPKLAWENTTIPLSPSGAITYSLTTANSPPKSLGAADPVGTMTVSRGGRLFMFALLGYNFQLGRNSVTLRLSNVFSTDGGAELNMCGSIIYTLNTDSCAQEVEFRRDGSLLAWDSVIQVEMSTALTITASYSSTCSPSTYYFSWQILKVLDTGASLNDLLNLQPLSYQCSAPQSASFVLDKYALTYGLYRLSVFHSPTSYPVNLLPRQLGTIKIIPSSLVCRFKGESDIAISLGDMLYIDYSLCRDPDDFLGNNSVRVVVACVGDSSPVVYNNLDCCSQDFGNENHWTQIGLYPNGTTPSPNAADFKMYDKKGKGSCFPNPNLLTYKESEKVVLAETEALNNNDMMKMCICGFDKKSRQASDQARLQVLNINSISDANNILTNLDPTNPTKALSVISMVSSTFKDSNDTDMVLAVKESACAKVDQVSQFLTDPNQAITLSKTLVTITTDGSNVNAQISSASALDNTAKSMASFHSASPEQVETATGGTLGTVGNIQPTLTPAEEDIQACVNNMVNIVGWSPETSLDWCDPGSAPVMSIARRRRAVRAAPLDPSQHKEEPERPKSTKCPLPDGDSLPDNVFSCIKNCTQLQNLLKYMMPDMRNELCSEKYQALLGQQEQRKKAKAQISTKSMSSLKTCSATSLGKGEKSQVASDKVTVASLRAPANFSSEEDGVGTSSNNGGVNVPRDLLGAGLGIGLQTFKNNPICHGDRAVKSPLTSVTINKVGGGEVPTKGVAKPISIFIKRGTPLQTRLYPIKHDDKVGNCHCANLTRDNQTLGISLRDLKNDTSVTEVNFAIYLNNGSCPEPEANNLTWLTFLPRSIEEIKANLSQSDAAMLKGQSGLQLQNELQNTYIFPANLTSTAGLYCVFVTLSQATVKFDTSTKPINPNTVYEFAFFIDNPVYFDEEKQKWKTDGISVGQLSCPSQMHLEVTHLTSFASDMVVPPNTIDFNTVWSKFKNLSENAAVFSTVISTLILYIILMIWGRIMDKKDIKRWGATNLQDNIPNDTYHYQISVMTGYRKGSGTNSKVYFILCGDNGDTGIRELSDGDRKGFPRGEVYNFIMSTESSLGSLTFLRIWHDNSGKGKEKSWYLDQVVINDLQTGEKSFFLCNNWLAVEEGDGQVERILPVSGLADLVAFKQLFSSFVQRKLRNEHLWFSIFSRPTRSAFTRVQRISCCLSLLFLTMITNAMFFKSSDNLEKRTGITIGPITFTLDQLFISVVSTLIVFPPSIIIITFFKKCKAKAAGNKVLQANQDLSTKSSKYTWRSVGRSTELFNIAEEGQASGSSAAGWDGDVDVSNKKTNRVWESLRNMLSFQSGRKETRVEDPELKKSKPFLFPHWCIYIAWVLVFLSVFGSAFFVILYSMEWGRDKSNDWLLTFLMSFLQNVVVVQPLKVLLLAAVISMIIKRPDMDDEEDAFDDAMLKQDEELLQKKEVDIQQIMLQRRTAREDLCVPNQEKLAEIRETRMKEIKMESIIKEMLAYSIFVLVVFFISYQTRSINSYKLGDVMRNTFTNSFDNSIQSYQAFYDYLNNTLVPKMYAGDFPDGTVATWREKMAINDGSRGIFRVGVPRLRQFRIKDNTCRPPAVFDAIIDKSCRGGYSWLDDDTAPYEPMWEPMEQDKWAWQKKNDTYNTPFVYSSSFKLKGLPFIAQVNTYKGGGYVFNFPRTVEEVRTKLEEIYEQNWLDTRTRAVFIEFTVYNAPSNLFASVIMVAEFMQTGSAFTYSEVKVFRLFSYVGSFGAIVLFMEIVFALFVLYFSIREGLLIKRERCAYFSGFWNILEFATLCITVTAVVMYGFKKILANIAMGALANAKSSDYVNFGSLASYDELYTYMVGIVVFISTVKFIKILRFNRRMGMLGATIKLAYKDLRSFVFMFVIYFVAFCSAAYLIFGTKLQNYRSFYGTLGALFSMALGVFQFKDLVAVSSLLGHCFLLLHLPGDIRPAGHLPHHHQRLVRRGQGQRQPAGQRIRAG
ncbi:hypothetical protein BOX15_Mlig010540g1 [Macrostomum lignano]|uniref:PLAT domain-containing protein n=1 Tax=Macrostomum lignano TaxID=282301 RepID=A0A267ED15_9PLAT|nr:hypothetical protein BOX15_Mlig010540g1 [Macrostomum lignano]